MLLKLRHQYSAHTSPGTLAGQSATCWQHSSSKSGVQIALPFAAGTHVSFEHVSKSSQLTALTSMQMPSQQSRCTHWFCGCGSGQSAFTVQLRSQCVATSVVPPSFDWTQPHTQSRFDVHAVVVDSHTPATHSPPLLPVVPQSGSVIM